MRADRFPGPSASACRVELLAGLSERLPQVVDGLIPKAVSRPLRKCSERFDHESQNLICWNELAAGVTAYQPSTVGCRQRCTLWPAREAIPIRLPSAQSVTCDDASVTCLVRPLRVYL